MSARLKGAAPMAIAVGVVAFVYVEVSLNFTFHWATRGDLGNGLHLPGSFHFAVPAAFIAWAFFFAAGADGKAARSIAISSLAGAVAGLLLFAFVAATKGLPDFWTIALGVGALAAVLVLAGSAGDWFDVPASFGAFACCVIWWIATGLDGWAEGGGGIGNTVAALAKPETAGSGAFAGVLSTPYVWVAVDVGFTLLVGVLCGLASVRLAGLLTPKAASAPAQPAAEPRGGRVATN